MDKARTALALVQGNHDVYRRALAHLDTRRQLRWIQTAERMARDPEMMKCDPRSVSRSFLDVASMGLDLSPHIGHAAVVRYGAEATVMVMFKGLVKLIDDRAPGALVCADVVHEGDEFAVVSGTEPSIRHVPKLDPARSRKLWTHVYAWVKLPSGAYYQQVMDREDVLRIRARSRAYRNAQSKGKSSPWHTDEIEMAKKTVTRRCMKLVPIGDRAQPAEAALGRAEAAEFAAEPREAEWRDVSGEQAADAALERAEAAQGAREEPEPAAEPDRAAEAATEPESDPDGDLFDQTVADPEECTACGAPGGEPHRAGCDAPPF